MMGCRIGNTMGAVTGHPEIQHSVLEIHHRGTRGLHGVVIDVGTTVNFIKDVICVPQRSFDVAPFQDVLARQVAPVVFVNKRSTRGEGLLGRKNRRQQLVLDID